MIERAQWLLVSYGYCTYDISNLSHGSSTRRAVDVSSAVPWLNQLGQANAVEEVT